MKANRKKIISILILLISVTTSKQRKIKSLVQLIHYGATSTTRIYHNENSKKYEWMKKVGLGELSSVGRRQMYLLGLQIHRNYSTLFSPPFDKDEVFFRVSGSNRSYHSAEILASAIFKDVFPREKLEGVKETDKRVQPPYKIDDEVLKINSLDPIPNGPIMVSIARKESYYDDVLKLGQSLRCSSLNINRQSEIEGAKLNKKKKLEFTNKIIEDLDLTIVKDGTLISCFKLSKFVYSNYFSNPDWENVIKPKTETWDKLTRCYQASSVVLMGDEESMMTSGTPLVLKIQEILKRRNKFLKIKKNWGLKYSAFLGSDPNFEKTLLILGLFNRDCVINQYLSDKWQGCVSGGGYGTTLNFEYFFDEETKKGEVNVKYKGTSRNVCGNKIFLEKIGLGKIYEKYQKIYSKKGDTEEFYCDFEDFDKILEKRVIKDWEKKCGINWKNDSPPTLYSNSMMAILIVANLIMLTVLYILFRLGNRKSRRSKFDTKEGGTLGYEIDNSYLEDFYDKDDDKNEEETVELDLAGESINYSNESGGLLRFDTDNSMI